MSTGFIFSSIIEILMAAAVILVIVKNKALCEFEEKIAERIRGKQNGRHALIVSSDDNYSHCA